MLSGRVEHFFFDHASFQRERDLELEGILGRRRLAFLPLDLLLDLDRPRRRSFIAFLASFFDKLRDRDRLLLDLSLLLDLFDRFLDLDLLRDLLLERDFDCSLYCSLILRSLSLQSLISDCLQILMLTGLWPGFISSFPRATSMSTRRSGFSAVEKARTN